MIVSLTCTDDFFLSDMLLLALFLIVAVTLGFIIGTAFGATRIHWPLIDYFRDYYKRVADQRLHSNVVYLKTLMNSFAPAAHGTDDRTTVRFIWQKKFVPAFSGRHKRPQHALPNQNRREDL